MTLSQFVADQPPIDRALVVVNRSAPDPVVNLLVDTFAGQPVEVSEGDLPDQPEDTVLLVEDGDVVATSPLSELRDAILLINSDLFVTGTEGLEEPSMPAVIRNLTGTPFRLRGYPESNKEKLLLIVVSRYIEHRSYVADAGTHRASFQRLSRIEDEHGTRSVYEQLADGDTDVHVYGLPDWTPPAELAMTVHGGHGPEFRDSWFVIHQPDDASGDPAALVALEVERRTWEGFWTFEPDLVSDIAAYVERNL